MIPLREHVRIAHQEVQEAQRQANPTIPQGIRDRLYEAEHVLAELLNASELWQPPQPPRAKEHTA